MRILWICNNILPDFCSEFGVKWNFGAGWVTGLLHAFSTCSGYDIGLCFPIIDEYRMKNSEYMGCRYYSFHMNVNYQQYSSKMKDEFLPILEDFHPDVIHIWGTERNHAKAVMEACEALGYQNRVLVYIQGIASMMSLHYALGVPKHVIEGINGNSEIKKEIDLFAQWGLAENELLRKTRFVTGRTEWDYAYVQRINPNAKYFFCNEILRDVFYMSKTKWSENQCNRHTIFMSQAHYPLKGLHFMIHALPQILDRYPDTEVYIAGFDPFSANSKNDYTDYGKYILDLMDNYGVKDKFHFLGILQEQEMVEAYLKANVYVLPSTIDNSPNSVAEAMMLGTPVVASYVGGVPDMICHGKTGFVYPCDEHYMMAHYILRVFTDSVLAEKMSQAEQMVAMKRHNPTSICERVRYIYHNMLESL